jgi:hypothetical protein
MHAWKRTARWGALAALLAPLAVSGVLVTGQAAHAAATTVDPYHATSLSGVGATGPMALSADGSVLAVAEDDDVAIYRTSDEERLGEITVAPSVAAPGQVRSLSVVGTNELVVAGDGGVEFATWSTSTTSGTTTLTPGTPVLAALPAGSVLADMVPMSSTKAYVLLDPAGASVNDSILSVDVTGTAPAGGFTSVPLRLPDVYSAIALSPRAPGSLYALTRPDPLSGSSKIVRIATGTGVPDAPVPLNTTSTTNPAISLAINPAGDRLYVGEQQQLVVLPTATLAQATTTLPPASAGYPTSTDRRANPLGLTQGTGALPERTSCDALALSTEGDTVYCTAAGENLYWFDADTLTYLGGYPLGAAAGGQHSLAASTDRAYIALTGSEVASVPVATVLKQNAVPYGSTPGAPRTVAVDPGNEQIGVSWLAPSGGASLPIVGYEVDAFLSYSPAQPVTAQIPDATCTPGGTGTTCTLTVDGNGDALSAGQTYLIVVSALNARGIGAPSAPVAAKLGVPTAPTGLSIGNATLSGTGKTSSLSQQVSWTAPSSPGATAIMSYQVCIDPQAAAGAVQSTCTATTKQQVSAAATSATIAGLAPATTYLLTVRADNSTGTGVTSAPLIFVAGTPSVPSNLVAKGANQAIMLSWSAPASTGGGPVTGYTATLQPGNIACPSKLTATATSCTFSSMGLTNGTTYTATVAAINADGTGPGATATATPASVPGAPKSPNVAPTAGGATVSWYAPTDDGGSPVIGYLVTATGHLTTGGMSVKTCSAPAVPGISTYACDLVGLTNGTPYSVTVVATNAFGNGSPAQSSYEAAGPSTPVTGIHAQVNAGTMLLQWNPPTIAGAESITGYHAVAVSGDGTGQRTCTTTAVPACSITGLPAGRYAVSVYATNSGGYESPASAPLSVIVVATPGLPAARLVRHAKSTDVTVRWSAVPGATSYRVVRTGGPVLKQDRIVSGGALSTTFAKLPAGTYQVTVAARTAQGSSAWSAALVVKVKKPTKATKPAKPVRKGATKKRGR